METFKTIGLWIGVSAAILFIVIFFLPSKVHMKRSIIIESTPHQVYEMVNDHKNFSKWLPRFAIDSTMRYAYGGARAGVGSEMAWKSDNEEVGRGKQWIVESKRDKYVKHEMEFGVDGSYTTEFVLENVPDGTKVIWTYTGDVTGTGIKNVIMGRFFGAFFIDNMLGEEYEQGLLSLKEVVESAPPVDDLADLWSKMPRVKTPYMYGNYY